MGLGRTTGDGWKLESLARWWMVERRRRRRCGSDVDALASQLPSLLSAALPAVLVATRVGWALENVPRQLEPGRWNMPTRRGRRCHRGLLPHGTVLFLRSRWQAPAFRSVVTRGQVLAPHLFFSLPRPALLACALRRPPSDGSMVVFACNACKTHFD